MFFKRKKNFRDSLKKLIETPTEKSEAAILYLGYSGVIVKTKNHLIAFDPADLLDRKEIEYLSNLELLLYTHGHGDHYDTSTLRKIFEKASPHVIVEPSLFDDASRTVPKEKIFKAEYGKSIEIANFKVTGIKGIHRGPITLYLVKTDDLSIFHGGDSAYVPLTKHTSDIAFVPTGSPSPTASPEDAYKMVNDLKPKAALPFHGSESQHKTFIKLVKENLPEIKTIQLREGEIIKI